MGRTWEKSELFSNFFVNISTFKVRPCFASPGKIPQIPQNEQKDQRRRSVWVGHDKFLKIGWNQQNPFEISKSCQSTVKLQFMLAWESAPKMDDRQFFCSFGGQSIKIVLPSTTAWNNKIVLLIYTKNVNSTILWGLNSYMNSFNSASNIREIGILLKCANYSCCFLFSFGKFYIFISQVKQRFNNILYCFNHCWFFDNADNYMNYYEPVWIVLAENLSFSGGT